MACFGWEEGLDAPSLLRYLHRLWGTFFVGSYLRFAWFRKTVQRQWAKESSFVACDVGCGNGTYSFYVARSFPQARIAAVDIDQESLTRNIHLAKRLGLSSIQFEHQDCLQWEICAEYDWLYSTCMLIYWERSVQLSLLQRLCRALKPGGWMYMMVPKQGYLEQSVLPLSWYERAYSKMADENRGYLYLANELKSDLITAGFTQVKVREVGGFWGRFACDLEYVLQERGWGRLKLILIPFLKGLCLLDTLCCVGHKSWLLVEARR